MSDKRAIAIFDSGLGGISVLKQFKQQLPHENYLYFGDSLHAPYGIKDKEEIIRRCQEICDYFIKQEIKAIVIACNTATSAAATTLRANYDIPVIGMEPALKVAAHNKSKQNIVVMATPFTLKETKFKSLLKEYSESNTVNCIACNELVEIVENKQLSNETLVNKQLNTYFESIDMSNVQSIVLGCTHFSFYIPYLHALFPHINIIDGNKGTVNHVKEILMVNKQLNDSLGSIRIENSDSSKIALCESLLED